MTTNRLLVSLLMATGLVGFGPWGPRSVAYGDEAIKEREVVKEREVKKDAAPFPEEKVIIVEVEPPAARKEVIAETERPAPEAVWVSGYWARRGDEWVWVKGVWAVPTEKTMAWKPGHWDKKDRQWQWVPGRWIEKED